MLTQLGSRSKRRWVDESSHQGSSIGDNVRTINASGEGRPDAPESHIMLSTKYMLPPIVTGTERALPPAEPGWLPASSSLQGPPPRPEHGNAPPESPSKRARLYYDPPYPSGPNRSQSSASRTPSSPSVGYDPWNPRTWSARKCAQSERLPTPMDSCRICVDSKFLVEKVVAGLEQLEAALKHVLASDPLAQRMKEERGDATDRPNVQVVGLRDSLTWASGSVESSTRLVQNLAASQMTSPRTAIANVGTPPAHEQREAPLSAYRDYVWASKAKNDKEQLNDGHQWRGLHRHFHYQRRSLGSAPLPPSPHPTISSASLYGSTQSPMGPGGSTRMLPSPSSLYTPSSTASFRSNFSPSSCQSPHLPNLHDLQYLISTKSLALSKLQREHDQLLAAHSRMQIRCQTLDKKSQISNHEMDTLADEKTRLQSRVEAFEVQVAELVTARDEAQKHMTANGAQYMQIVDMSSKLQAQGVEETKRYKTDREAWERDRESLERRIEELQAGQAKRYSQGNEDGPATTVPEDLDPDHVLASATLDELKSEIVRLRSNLCSMKQAFTDGRRDAEKVGHIVEECTTGHQPQSAIATATNTATTTVATIFSNPSGSEPEVAHQFKKVHNKVEVSAGRSRRRTM